MVKSFKVKSFKYGFILGGFLSLITQLIDYADYVFEKERLKNLSRISGISFDGIWSWGFPFPISYGGDFIVLALLLDIVIALMFSFVLGLIFKLAWSKISVRRLK